MRMHVSMNCTEYNEGIKMDKNYAFFALLDRMQYINRWALMRNEHSENLAEHSFEVSVIAHALTVIGNKRFGKKVIANLKA